MSGSPSIIVLNLAAFLTGPGLAGLDARASLLPVSSDKYEPLTEPEVEEERLDEKAVDDLLEFMAEVELLLRCFLGLGSGNAG